MSINAATEVGFPKYSPLEAGQEKMSALPHAGKIQRGLMVVTLACSILWAIPPLRIGAGLALRAVSFLSSTATFADRWTNDTALGRILKVAKMAAVVVGLAGLAAASPLLVVASVAADAGIQALEMVKAFYHGDVQKGCMYLATLIVDVLVLASITACSWELMVAASAVGMAAMVVFTVKALYDCYQSPSAERFFDVFCGVALSVITCNTGIVTAKEIPQEKRAHYSYRNWGVFKKFVANDKHGKVVAEILSDKEVHFSIPIKDTTPANGHLYSTFIHVEGYSHGTYIPPYSYSFPAAPLLSVPTLGTGIVLDGLLI